MRSLFFDVQHNIWGRTDPFCWYIRLKKTTVFFENSFSFPLVNSKIVFTHFGMDNRFFVFFWHNPCPNLKKKVRLPLKKVTKKVHFLQKNNMKILLPMGKKHVFFCQFSTKFQGQKWKIGLFPLFLTPNSNYKVRNLTQKMTKKTRLKGI